jgi:hypothetical protein
MSRGVRIALWTDLVLIALFGISSGLYKVFGGEADVVLYGTLGVGRWPMGAIGAVQAALGIGLFFPKTRVPSAIGLALVNLFASIVLFVNGIIPFAPISLVFVAMALAPIWLRDAARQRA